MQKQKEEPRRESRPAPSNVEAEGVVLNEMLTEGASKTLYGLDALKATDFYLENNRRVFQAIEALIEEGGKVNLITVGERLKRAGQEVKFSHYPQAGMLGGMIEAANIVRDLARRRELLATINELADAIFSGEPMDKIAPKAINKILESSSTARSDPVPLGVAVNQAIKRIEDAMSGIAGASEPTGIEMLDRLTSGLFATDLIVVGGRPGLGKTAFAMTLAMNLAERGKRSLFVNAEMPATQLATRSLAMKTGIPNFALRRGRFDESKVPILVAQAGKMFNYPLSLYIENDWQRIKAKIQAEKMRNPDLCLVVLDYIQRFRNISNGDRIQRYQELGRVADESKNFAMRLKDLTVVMLSQLNRSLDTEDRKPTLRDLRESGDIEAAADGVWLLHQSKDDGDRVDLVVPKSRSGPTGEVPMRYYPDEVRFGDWEEKQQQYRTWNDW